MTNLKRGYLQNDNYEKENCGKIQSVEKTSEKGQLQKGTI